MSVSVSPSSSIGFNRPLTQLVKRSLTIANNNQTAVAFKVKTTAPKIYCVRPNSGRIESGETIDISVMLQPMKEDPPTATKCKDKFLIQSVAYTTETNDVQPSDLFTTPGMEKGIHQHKLKVVYLPAEGIIEEEEEGHQHANDSGLQRYTTVRQPNGNDDTMHSMPDFSGASEIDKGIERPHTPAADYDESHEEPSGINGHHAETEPAVSAPPAPIPVVAAAAKFEPAAFTPGPSVTELETQLYLAQAEIERLRSMLESQNDNAVEMVEHEDEEPAGLRRRTRKLSDVTSTVAPTEIGSLIDVAPSKMEGVPLNVVLIIAIGVFVTTYLFF